MDREQRIVEKRNDKNCASPCGTLLAEYCEELNYTRSEYCEPHEDVEIVGPVTHGGEEQGDNANQKKYSEAVMPFNSKRFNLQEVIFSQSKNH